MNPYHSPFYCYTSPEDYSQESIYKTLGVEMVSSNLIQVSKDFDNKKYLKLGNYIIDNKEKFAMYKN